MEKKNCIWRSESLTLSDSSSQKFETRVKRHFEDERVGNEVFRICKACDCTKRYRKSTGHSTMKKHWSYFHERETGGVITLNEKDHVDELVKHLVLDNKPFKTVDTKSFRAFANSMNPDKLIPSRHRCSNIIRNKIPPVHFLVKRNLQKAAAVSLTYDMWTSTKQDGFACVTAHLMKILDLDRL